MLKKALPFSFSESAGIVNGSFESQKTAKFVRKTADSGAKNTPFQGVYHLRINHKLRVGCANRSLTYAWTHECAVGALAGAPPAGESKLWLAGIISSSAKFGL
jgi:hypothetical protein